MKVVITGGTGFIGRALSSELRREGHELVLLTRDPKRAAAREPRPGPGLEYAAWDPYDGSSYRAHLEGADAVVHLAGEGVFDQRWSEERKAELRASRVDVTAELARALAGATAKPRVFVSGSAVGIYGQRKDDHVSDESDAAGDDFLAVLAVAWEKAADPARSAGLRVAHPRIGIVLEEGGGALARLLPPFRLGLGGPLGDGRQWFSWIHLHDAVAALRFALTDERVEGPFNVTAPEPVTMNDLARGLGKALRRPALARVPAFALKLALGEGVAETLLTGQRAVPRRLQGLGFAFRYSRLDDALQAIVGAPAAGRDAAREAPRAS